jgi:hypothetical protein
MREQSTSKQPQQGGAMDEPRPDPGMSAESQAARPGKLPVPQMLHEGPNDDPSMGAVITYPSAAWSKARRNPKSVGVGRKPARARPSGGINAARGKGSMGASRRRQAAK